MTRPVCMLVLLLPLTLETANAQTTSIQPAAHEEPLAAESAASAPSNSSPVRAVQLRQKWRTYQHYTCAVLKNTYWPGLQEAMAKEFNAVADRGWELVTITPVNAGTLRCFVATFKAPKMSETPLPVRGGVDFE